MADVFITVSAGKTILKGQTDREGKLRFSSVTPQKYYLTAIKKEYSFGSKSMTLEVLEEEHKVQVLQGDRVAFSAFGSVTTLAGQPIPNGKVIAKSGDNIEQATILENGTFRVMGLVPGKTYDFSVESYLIERTLPDVK